jgi:hypothetical protein
MKRRSLKSWMVGPVIVLGFLVLIIPELLTVPVTVLMTLLTGWWFSLGRLLNVWHPALPSVLLFGVTVIVVVAGTHAFLSWLHGSLCRAKGAAPAPVWPWKWTLCGFAMIVCALLGIGCVVLTTHQLYWMAKSTDPVFTDPMRDRVSAIWAVSVLQHEAEAAQWDRAKTQAAFWQKVSTQPGQPAAEGIQPVWIEPDGRTLRGVILVPRHPLFDRTASVFVIQPGKHILDRPLSELPQVLTSFDIGGSGETATPPAEARP